MKKIAITGLFLLMPVILVHADLFKPNENVPVDISAGRAIYRWEIKKAILENSNNIKPYLTQGDSQLQANTIIYDENEEVGHAFERIVYENKKEGIVLRAGEGSYYTKDKKIIAKKSPRLYMTKDGVEARSWVMTFYQDSDFVNMWGDVRIIGKDYELKGDNARIYQKTGLFKITGNAQTMQGENTLSADKIDINSKNNHLDNYTARGNVVVENKKENYNIYAGRLDYFKDLGYSRITREPRIEFKKNDIIAYSKVMEQFEKEDKANLLGNVIIVQGNRKAYAKWGVYYVKQKRMILTGNPILVDGKSRMKALKIIVEVEEGTMRMVGGGEGVFEYRQ